MHAPAPEVFGPARNSRTGGRTRPRTT